MKYFFIIIFTFLNVVSFSQSKYIFDNIPDSLKENADYIVWERFEKFTLSDKGSAIERSKIAVCIIDQYSRLYNEIGQAYNENNSIIKFSANIYDKNGKLVKKLKTSDIRDISAVQGGTMYNDQRVKYAVFTNNEYPYTVEFETVRKINGIINYPDFYFQARPNTSIISSKFSVVIPKTMQFKYREYNLSKKAEITTDKIHKRYEWKEENLPAFEPIENAPSLIKYTPVVITTPKEFEMDGYSGNMESWNNFAKWNWELNKGRDNLSEATINKIEELTKNKSDNYEKIRSLYKYMQDHTRYVSVQLGIGGLQTYPASYVEEKGYGDCKALSNYMYSLLKAIGIKSHYTLVNAGPGKSDIINDFPSIQFNHAILCVPLKKDTVWLECTSQQKPFNFLGSFTDDRHVLLISEEGGKLVKTPRYGKEINTQHRDIELKLDAEGHAKAKVHTEFRGLKYEEREGWSSESVTEQKDALKETYAVSGMEINDFKFKEFKDEIPSIQEDLDLTIMRFATTSGKRMFIKMNVFNQATYVPKNEERKIPFRLTSEFIDVDTLSFEIPEGYSIENQPKDYDIATKFGSYSCKFEQTGNKIKFVRKYSSEKGIFPAEDYKAYYEFRKTIKKADKAKLVLVKKL